MNRNKERKKKKVAKVLLRITIVVLFLLTLILFLITMASTIISKDNLAFIDYKFYIMKASSEPEIAHVGDLVIVEKYKPNTVQAGDKIVYSGNNDNKFYYCNSVNSTKKQNIIMKMITVESNGVQYQFEESEVEGKVIATVPLLGRITTFLRTILGKIVFILYIICLFILLRVIFTRRKMKDKNTEDISTEDIIIDNNENTEEEK